jgi:hypothetical protein
MGKHGTSGQRHWGMVWHFDGRGVCLFLPGGEWNTEGIVFFFWGVLLPLAM